MSQANILYSTLVRILGKSPEASRSRPSQTPVQAPPSPDCGFSRWNWPLRRGLIRMVKLAELRLRKLSRLAESFWCQTRTTSMRHCRRACFDHTTHHLISQFMLLLRIWWNDAIALHCTLMLHYQ